MSDLAALKERARSFGTPTYVALANALDRAEGERDAANARLLAAEAIAEKARAYVAACYRDDSIHSSASYCDARAAYAALVAACKAKP